MKRAGTILFLSVALSLLAGDACAQDLSGDWQGTIKTGARESGRYRYLLRVAKVDGGGWKATLRAIDQRIDWGAAMPVSFLSLQDSHLKFSIAEPEGSYEGTVSTDGASISGVWRQGLPQQLDFVRPTRETEWRDESPHSAQFVAVDHNVELEVLDWGGSGPPLVLLAGLGNTAHIFDQFAPKLTAALHVYGITRRGYGSSSVPDSGYEADRLGDDVAAVIDALKLNRPVLAGHSIAGQELSSIGFRHPDKISGLIYLDAGYSYAFYDRAVGDFNIDLRDTRRKLQRLEYGMLPRDAKQLIEELLRVGLPALQRDFQERDKDLASIPLASSTGPPPPRPPFVPTAILAGTQKYTDVRVPILAIFAVPHNPPDAVKSNAAALAAFDAREYATVGVQAKAFETGLPTATVVRLKYANHYLFQSNEAEVLSQIKIFLAKLK